MTQLTLAVPAFVGGYLLLSSLPVRGPVAAREPLLIGQLRIALAPRPPRSLHPPSDGSVASRR